MAANVTVNRDKLNQKKIEERKHDGGKKKPNNHDFNKKGNHDKKDFKKPENNNGKPAPKVYRQDSGETYRPFEIFFKKQQEENKKK